MSPVINKLFSSILLPPGSQILLLFLGVFWFRVQKVLSILMILLATVSLYLFSIPAISERLLVGLETYPPINFEERASAGAIVVLGSGRYSDPPEYGLDTVNGAGLVRLRYAAKLAKKLHLPILVSGGKPLSEELSEAELMTSVLVKEFGVTTPVWLESDSYNTLENAKYTQKILKDRHINNIILVTHAWHMPRSVWSFKQVGMEVIPAPTQFTAKVPVSFFRWLPSAAALHDSMIACHEYVGQKWYELKAAI